jgi:diguanylate cyclase (GGDEF)-like protein
LPAALARGLPLAPMPDLNLPLLQWLAAYQMALPGVAWCVLALLLRESRSALIQWGLFMMLLGTGLGLASLRGEPRDWLSYNGANIAAVVAFALMRSGTEQFLRLPRSNVEQAWTLIPVVLLIAAAGPAEHWSTLRIVLSYSAQSYLMLRTMAVIRPALIEQLGRKTMVAIVVPGALIGIILAGLGLGQVLRWPQPADILQTVPTHLALMATYVTGGTLFCFMFMLLLAQRMLANLHEASSRDALTGLYNRRSMIEQLGRQWQRHRRTQAPLAIMTIDLDHFKRINDTLGHTAGDSVLVHLTKLLQNHVRGEDLVGRVGGEEFMLLLPDTEPQQAISLAERLRVLVRAEALGTTISVGIALAHSVDKDPESMIARADAALFRAKEAGRNRIEVAD